MSARWLTSEVDAALERIDAEAWRTRKTGCLQINVHYRGGRPLVAKACDVLPPPTLVEVSLTITSSTS